MKLHPLKVLGAGLFAASALALASGATAQTPPPTPPPAAAKTPQPTPMAGHHMGSHPGAQHHADLKAECQGMVAWRQEMQDKFKAMDATLDKLVAEMNAAKGSKTIDALEKPMAAVINEMVAQRKASRSMMMKMQPEMMGHMAHHMDVGGAKDAMDCPMTKMGSSSGPKAEEMKHSM